MYKTEKNLHIEDFLLMIYYAWFFTPYLRTVFDGVFKYVFFPFFALGLGILFLDNLQTYRTKPSNKNYSIVVPIIAYILAILAMAWLEVADAKDNIRVSLTFFGTAFVYSLYEYDIDRKVRFGNFLLVLFLVTSVTTIVGVIADPGAARAVANASKTKQAFEEDYILGKKNISSLYLFQSMAIMTPIFVSFIRNQKKMIGIVSFAVCFFAILKASFTICLLVFFVGIILSLFYIKGNSKAFLFAIILIVVLFLPWESIFNWLSKTISNKDISKRMTELSLFFSTGNATGDSALRSLAYESSLKTFLSNPFGIGPLYSYKLGEDGIGYHSQFLDDLARYGVFGLAFYIMFFYRYYKMLKKEWNKVSMGEVAFPITILYFIFVVLNISFRSSVESVVMLYIILYIPDMMVRKRNLNEEN